MDASASREKLRKSACSPIRWKLRDYIEIFYTLRLHSKLESVRIHCSFWKSELVNLCVSFFSLLIRDHLSVSLAKLKFLTFSIEMMHVPALICFQHAWGTQKMIEKQILPHKNFAFFLQNQIGDNFLTLSCRLHRSTTLSRYKIAISCQVGCANFERKFTTSYYCTMYTMHSAYMLKYKPAYSSVTKSD